MHSFSLTHNATNRRDTPSRPWSRFLHYGVVFCALFTLQSSLQAQRMKLSYFSEESWFLSSKVIPLTPVVTMIPHKIWFTYRFNILETKTPEHYYNNVMKIINTYTSLWNSSTNIPTEVYFIDDNNCTDLLNQVDPLLAKAFEQEGRGDLKADLCRTAALYLHGGYYFDVDMDVVQPLDLPDNVSFATSMSASYPIFFNSFIATSPRSDIMNASVASFYQYYINETGFCRTNINFQEVVGCCTLWDGYQKTPIEKRGETFILEEVNLNTGLYPNYPTRGYIDPDCDYVVHHNASHQIYFYSRIFGSGHCQK